MARITALMVIEEIRKAGAKGVTREDLAKSLNSNENAIHNHTLRISRYNPCPIRSERDGRRVRYFFVSPVVDEKEESVTKNAEGYNDPTMAQAIKNIENQDRYNGFSSGFIYKMINNGDFLVVRPYPDTLLGFNIDTSRIIESNNDHEVSWTEGDIIYRIKCNRLTSVSAKKLNCKSSRQCPVDKFKDVVRRSPLFSCRVVEIPGQVVEKKVISQAAISLEVNKTLDSCTEKLAKAIGIPVPPGQVADAFARAVSAAKTATLVRDELKEKLKAALEREPEVIENFVCKPDPILEKELEFYKAFYKDTFEVLKQRGIK